MDAKELGKPLYWHGADHVRAVEQMIRADEIELALEMCERLPAWYRIPENYPPELKEIKRVVARQLYDQIEYANDDEEANCTREFGEAQWTNGYMHPRAEIIERIVRTVDELEKPWIFDLGASHGNLPLGLMQAKCKFHYKGVGLNWRIIQKVREWASGHWREKPAPGQTTILFCSEVLEHASRMQDIVVTANKECVEWDVIVLSVPFCTLGGGLPNYADRRLGHVRTLNAQDLFAFANKHWPGYAWELTIAASQVIVGRK